MDYEAFEKAACFDLPPRDQSPEEAAYIERGGLPGLCHACGLEGVADHDDKNRWFCSHCLDQEPPYGDGTHKFWRRVEIGPVVRAELGPCWEFVGAISEGYGNLKFEGRYVRAHRVAWTLEHGTIAAGVSILHRCDNRRCCRPAHLFEGTQADNVADMMTKGRQRPSGLKGERHGRAKLSWPVVRAIRERVADGATKVDLALQYGVSDVLVGLIVRRRIWKEVQP